MKKTIFLAFIISVMMTNPATAQRKRNKLKFFGDVRLRVELDRNSKKSNGDMRTDRDRLRYRMRFGFKYKVRSNFEIGGRIRTGNPYNAQSSNVTVGDNLFNTEDLSVDKAYIKYHIKNFYVWGGKNTFNMWAPDHMLWDGDINPEGIGLGNIFRINRNQISVNAGYFIINNTKKDNKQTFGKHANIAFSQIKFQTTTRSNKIIIAPTILRTYTKDLLGINYTIFAGYAQFKMRNGLDFHIDYFNNFENLKGKVNSDFENQKMGIATGVNYRIFKNFFVNANYAHIEKYAVIDMLAQDDWVRWGNSLVDNRGNQLLNYTMSSNFGGFGFGLKYKLNKNTFTQLKFWNVKGIVKYGAELETGTRIRLDFNLKF